MDRCAQQRHVRNGEKLVVWTRFMAIYSCTYESMTLTSCRISCVNKYGTDYAGRLATFGPFWNKKLNLWIIDYQGSHTLGYQVSAGVPSRY